MTDKPSKNEEEYFALREAENLRERRAAAAASAREAERRDHYMKCPKCGADLHTEMYRSIQVDRCPECDGIWFDAGEAEQLVAENERTGVAGLFAAIVQGVGRPSRATPKE